MSSNFRFLTVQNAIFIAGLALGLYHLMLVSGVIAISTIPMGVAHVILALSLFFVVKPTTAKLAGTRLNSVLSFGRIIAMVGASIWMLTVWKAIAFSGGMTIGGNLIAGAIIIAVVFEAARRGIGLILAMITFVFFL